MHLLMRHLIYTVYTPVNKAHPHASPHIYTPVNKTHPHASPHIYTPVNKTHPHASPHIYTPVNHSHGLLQKLNLKKYNRNEEMPQ